MLRLYVAMQTRLVTRSAKKGQSLAEYGLILALVAVLCIASLQLLGGNIQLMINNLAQSIGGVAST